ncbi:2'-5' RNA ligase family protein [Flavobacterium cupreum]|uniref:2'-5' RNA ligase family protein n=1 Tax=Flavobacterium cupreum TaxID=2133766 RepID=A0A434ADB5_9FLAO|nr:2'-5' RNA ligase family protein [Flavobacterium cupreum]RUT72361.1 2'-5' RNA ligase family protein [Flavobacterium cupreum]
MENKYSVVIQPREIIDPVRTMKEDLGEKIGWFNSKNSLAHITIFEFTSEKSQLDKTIQKLFKVCDTFTPFYVNLDHFDSYDNGAFFIGVNENPKIPAKSIIKRTPKTSTISNIKKRKTNEELNLKIIMKKTQDSVGIKNIKKSTQPHVSIARKLTPENLKIASELFTIIDITFLCKEIILREFDPIKKQFFAIETFPFGSNPQPELIQGSLF